MAEDSNMDAQLKEALEEQPSLPEAGGSATTHIEGPSGVDIMLTSRSYHPYDAFKRLEETVKMLIKQGYKPIEGGSYSAHKQQQHPADSDVPPNDGYIDIEDFTISLNEGKMYFKIKGGPYKKWGITVWPEVLINTFGQEWFDGLNPLKPPKITGRAYYSNNEKGQPDKVVSIRQ